MMSARRFLSPLLFIAATLTSNVVQCRFLFASDDDRDIGGIDRYYQAKIYLNEDHTLHQPAFYTDKTGCLNVRVMMSDDILTETELAAKELDDGWTTMCRGHVYGQGLDNNERTYMLPNQCDSKMIRRLSSKYLYIGVDEGYDDDFCRNELNAAPAFWAPDWASECDCFLRWNGTTEEDNIPWYQPAPSSTKGKGKSGSGKSGSGKSGSAKAKAKEGKSGSKKL